MRTNFLAEHRTPTNSTGLKQLRKEGRLPGIIFGSNVDNAMIHISAKEFQQWTKGGGTGIIELNLGGTETVPVLLESVQRDAVSREFIHVDFLRVQKNEAVRTKILIDYVGTAVGSKRGGIVQTQGSFIEIQGLPDRLQASITVDISALDVGESLLVGDIELPSGLTLISSPSELLVSVVAPKVESAG